MAYKQKSNWNELMGNGNGKVADAPHRKPDPIKIGDETYNTVEEALKKYNTYQDKMTSTPGHVATSAADLKSIKSMATGETSSMIPGMQQYGPNLTYTGRSQAGITDKDKLTKSIGFGGEGSPVIAIQDYVDSHPALGTTGFKEYEDKDRKSFYAQQYGEVPYKKFKDANLSSTTEDVPVERQAETGRRRRKVRSGKGSQYMRKNFQSKLKELGIETFGNRQFEYEGENKREQRKNWREDKRDDIEGFGDKAQQESKTTYFQNNRERDWDQGEYDNRVKSNEKKKAEHKAKYDAINLDRISLGLQPYK